MVKERKYWTKEKCIEEALKYKTRSEFQKNSKGSYMSCVRNGWLDEVCANMIGRRYKDYWTKEKCIEESMKYKSYKDFRKLSSVAYQVSIKNGWSDLISEYLSKKNTLPLGYWTKEKCIEEASKYTSRREFRIGSYIAYQTSIKKGWLDEVCIELPGSNSKKYWTKEKCIEESIKYTTKLEFSKNSSSAYQTSYRNGWLNEICMHMVSVGNKYKRCIYAIEFEDKSAYIGLTYNLNERFTNHISPSNRNRSAVIKHIRKTGLIPIIKQLTDYICIYDAVIEEGLKIKEYKQNGWFIINSAKHGSLGSNKLIWDLDKCIDEYKKYDSKCDFRKNSPSAYRSVIRHKWQKYIWH